MVVDAVRNTVAAPWNLATSVVSIVHVVGHGSEIQMLRIAARWIVAFVTHQETVRYRAIGQHPGKPMGINALTTIGQVPVSGWLARPSELKAAILGALKSRPEIFGRRLPAHSAAGYQVALSGGK
jgi:hypothetical protein